MKKIYFYLSFIMLFIVFSKGLYADGVNFECNDLYGDCNNTSDSNYNTSNSGYDSSRNTKQNTDNVPSNPKNQPSNITNNTKSISSQNAFFSSGTIGQLGMKKKSFLYSVVFLTALFDNGVQKQGYGILLKDGYTLTAADLMNEEGGAYLKSVTAKMQDDSSNSLMCFAMLRLRATDTKLSLLRAENYTDIYCNTRPESFYHQRINLHYYTPIRAGTLKNTILSRSDNVLFPFITEKNMLSYKTSSIANIQKHPAVYGLPLFNSGGSFVGFLYTTNNSKQKNVVISSDEVRDFVCMVVHNRLLPTSDLTRACVK
ncbi:hypothetical protein CQA53_09030 [Helicobacter didelphidarum]|uniref:Serine protease n=1 Tax=Helicobacter didelphidarum TaxID=2040648 RepID=A0A3D8ICN3_9HELI|nr:hypothetical protein [Helicobacter didelphidarum]RDU62840.1 hypothetical protein CQA53_09030 [Helicobacter didelphidarum]